MTATGHGLAHCGIQISQRAPTRAKTKHVGDNAAAAQVYVSSGMRLGIKRCTVSVSDQSGGFFLLVFFWHYVHYFANKRYSYNKK